MQCVILAGGLATRLWPVTQSIPKSLISINGRPFAEYQLAWLARQHITDIVFCIGYLGAQIRSAFGTGSPLGLKIRYADEGEHLKGTGGALRVALDAGVLDENFFVLYGDSFLPIPFPPVMEAHHSSGRSALMTVMRNENRWDTSNVIFEAPLVTLYDKACDDMTRRHMKFIDYGLLVLSRDLVTKNIPAGRRVDLAEVLKPLSLDGELAGLEITERFYEVGSQSGIAEFARYAARTSL